MIRHPLTKGCFTLLSDDDAALAELRWYANRTRWGTYAERSVGRSGPTRQRFLLHREIMKRMGVGIEGLMVDHINGDPLDNRRENLRAVTAEVNSRNIGGPRSHNTSGHLGVSYDKSRNRWMAYIVRNKRFINIGRFGTKDEAVSARLAAERDLWGIQPRRAEAHA